ncbi:hypothetical protein C170_28628 [Paenibacillus sp. FSL H7-689]|nr:hypothetical protein C170_28628 [Paenibacillus sp. FSL H7-689]
MFLSAHYAGKLIAVPMPQDIHIRNAGVTGLLSPKVYSTAFPQSSAENRAYVNAVWTTMPINANQKKSHTVNTVWLFFIMSHLYY